METSNTLRGTTILSVRRDGQVALGGDGQVTLGQSIMKADAVKIRRLRDGQVLAGFAGAVADSFALLERFGRHDTELELDRKPRRAPDEYRDRVQQSITHDQSLQSTLRMAS